MRARVGKCDEGPVQQIPHGPTQGCMGELSDRSVGLAPARGCGGDQAVRSVQTNLEQCLDCLQGECSCRCAEEEEEIQRRSSACSQYPPHTDAQRRRISASAERRFPIPPSYRRAEEQEGMSTSVECFFSMTPLPCSGGRGAGRGGEGVLGAVGRRGEQVERLER